MQQDCLLKAMEILNKSQIKLSITDISLADLIVAQQVYSRRLKSPHLPLLEKLYRF